MTEVFGRITTMTNGETLQPPDNLVVYRAGSGYHFAYPDPPLPTDFLPAGADLPAEISKPTETH